MSECKLLIADDDEDILHLMEICLRDFACQVDSATTGREVLARYHLAKQTGKPYDLLILDVAMPLDTGLAALEQIRAEGDKETRAIIVTALPPDDVEGRAAAVGVLGIWYKPFEVRQFKQQVARFLDKRVAASPARASEGAFEE